MVKIFEFWYDKVSNGGRQCTRSNTTPHIIKRHKNDLVKKKTTKTTPIDLTEVPTSACTTTSTTTDELDEVKRKITLVITINKMLKTDCIKQLENFSLRTDGKRSELRDRLAAHYGVDLVNDAPQSAQKTTDKHKANWSPVRRAVSPAPFTAQDFNQKSLETNLPGYKDNVLPEPHDCYSFFHTQDMWDMERNNTNVYPFFFAHNKHDRRGSALQLHGHRCGPQTRTTSVTRSSRNVR